MVKCEFLIRKVYNGSYLNDIVKNKAMFPSFGSTYWVPKIYCDYVFTDGDSFVINRNISKDNELIFIIDISILKYEPFLICNEEDLGDCSKPGHEDQILLKGNGNGIKPDLKELRKHLKNDPSHEVLFDYIPINYIKAILTHKDNIPYVKNIFKDIKVFSVSSLEVLINIYKQPIDLTIKDEDQYKIQKEIEHCKIKKEIYDMRYLLSRYKIYKTLGNTHNICKNLISYIQDHYSITGININHKEIVKMVKNILTIKTKIDLIDLITILKYCLYYIEKNQKHNAIYDILTELNEYI